LPTTTDIDVERFRADGYLLPGRQLFAPAKLDRLEAIFAEHLAGKGSKLSDELQTGTYATGPCGSAIGLPKELR